MIITIEKVDNGFIVRSEETVRVVEEDEGAEIGAHRAGAQMLREVRDLLGVPSNDNSLHVVVSIVTSDGGEVME